MAPSRHLRLAAGSHRLALLRFDRTHLRPPQRQPLALALDLGTHPGQKLARMLPPPALPQAPAHLLHPQVVHNQQRTNPIAVSDSLLPQPLKFAVCSPLVFLLRRGYP